MLYAYGERHQDFLFLSCKNIPWISGFVFPQFFPVNKPPHFQDQMFFCCLNLIHQLYSKYLTFISISIWQLSKKAEKKKKIIAGEFKTGFLKKFLTSLNYSTCSYSRLNSSMRVDMKRTDRGKHELRCWYVSAAGPEAAALLPSSGRQIESSLEKAWERELESNRERGRKERERNNRFHLNSLLSLILFELTANFACLHRPTPLSQKRPALPTSNLSAQPVAPTPAHCFNCLLQNKGQSWRREADTPLSSSNHLWHILLFSAACVNQF